MSFCTPTPCYFCSMEITLCSDPVRPFCSTTKLFLAPFSFPILAALNLFIQVKSGLFTCIPKLSWIAQAFRLLPFRLHIPSQWPIAVVTAEATVTLPVQLGDVFALLLLRPHSVPTALMAFILWDQRACPMSFVKSTLAIPMAFATSTHWGIFAVLAIVATAKSIFVQVVLRDITSTKELKFACLQAPAKLLLRATRLPCRDHSIHRHILAETNVSIFKTRTLLILESRVRPFYSHYSGARHSEHTWHRTISTSTFTSSESMETATLFPSLIDPFRSLTKKPSFNFLIPATTSLSFSNMSNRMQQAAIHVPRQHSNLR